MTFTLVISGGSCGCRCWDAGRKPNVDRLLRDILLKNDPDVERKSIQEWRICKDPTGYDIRQSFALLPLNSTSPSFPQKSCPLSSTGRKSRIRFSAIDHRIRSAYYPLHTDNDSTPPIRRPLLRSTGIAATGTRAFHRLRTGCRGNYRDAYPMSCPFLYGSLCLRLNLYSERGFP